MRWITLSQPLLALACLAGSAAAQAPARHANWGVSAGLGPGAAWISCPLCRGGSEAAPSGYIRLGVRATPRFLVGGEFTGWTYHGRGADEFLGALLGFAVWYPGRSGFHLKAGVGLGRYQADDNVDELTLLAPAGQLGAGYDWRVGRRWALTPYVQLLGTAQGTLKFNGNRVTDGADLTLLQAGLGVTWF